jgi:hypothetical protein
MFKKYLIFILIIFSVSSCQTVSYEKYSFLSLKDKNFSPPSKSKYIRGVSKEQWTIINKIGDPLNCEERIKKINKIKKGHIITAQAFSKDPYLITQSLFKNKVTILTEGIYNPIYPIRVPENKYLIGEGEVIINANVITAIYNSGNIKNLTIQNAKRYGVYLKNFSTTYNVLVTGTGINHPLNSQGNGVHSSGPGSHGNCVVSVETSFGYNEQGSSQSTVKGGNADGFTVKYGAHDITLIDTHAHHNSDDGYDFWKGGAEKPVTKYQPTIRIFYSSANHNGKNPYTPNGDGNGFKFGSWDQYQKNKGKDKGDRLIYGSVACYNREKGFDRNRTSMKIIAEKIHATGNNKNYKDVSNINSKILDKFALKCNMFSK